MGQSALCFLKGRSSRFFNSPLFVQSCRGKFLYLVSVWSSFFVFIWYYKAFGFPNILRLLPWILSFLWWRFFFLFFVLRYFVSGVCLSIHICLLLFYIGCAGSVGISLAGRVIYSLCVWLRCVECRAGTILFGHFLGADGGTVQIFSFSLALL